LLQGKGIEKYCKFMIPTVIILLLVLAIIVVFLPQTLEGYEYLLTPRWKFLFDTMASIISTL
jgi:NSS family neurotransmitter:Na+ symporter